MARPLRGLLGPLIALALAAGLAAGCGGGDGDGEDRAQGLPPADLLAQSADAAEAAGPFRIALEVTGQVDLTDPVVGAGRQPAERPARHLRRGPG